MANEKFRLVSPDPENGGRLPRKYTADGQGALKELSPPLEWHWVPYGTKSLALLVQDIDAPKTLEPIGAVGPLGGDQHTTFSQGSPCRLLSHGTSIRFRGRLCCHSGRSQRLEDAWIKGAQAPHSWPSLSVQALCLEWLVGSGKKGTHTHTHCFSEYIGSGAAHLVIWAIKLGQVQKSW